MSNLKGKTVIVTGAAQGIGREIALHFAREGCNIVVADINYDGAKETAGEIENAGMKSLAVDVDISSHNQVQHMINRTKEQYDKIDILVNNAAYVRKVKFLDYTVDDWTGILNVTLNGYFYCTQFAAKEMVKTGGGKIINISSMVGMIAHGGLTAYAVAKSGIISMTKLSGMELKKHNITVNAIAPGPVDTPLMKNVLNKMEAGKTGMMLPPSAIGKTEDVAKAALWLAKNDNSFINGNIIDLGAAIIG